MPPPAKTFDIDALLFALGSKRNSVRLGRNQILFVEGERSDSMFYIESGTVKLTVTSSNGREAIIGIFDDGDFLGESCIVSDRPIRFHTATAMTDVRLVKIGRDAIVNRLRAAGDAFYALVSSILRQNARTQQDFANRLLEPSDKRLARALLALSRLNERQIRPLDHITQQDWAEMIGISRQRVNVLLRQFRKSGLVSDARGVKVNPDILTVIEDT
jgi:CRP-like cAMP-binding protein